ncbi:MAG: hypothetical protein ACE5JI_09515 [Acidobacteriota bacterium]
MTVDEGSFRVLLVSLGELNGLLLKLLARMPAVSEIIVATRRSKRTLPTINLVRMGAGAEGCFPVIRTVAFDLNEVETAAETLSTLEPDVTLAAPSLQSWWVLDRIPPEAAAPLRPAPFGAWLPFHLAPMISLMKAWKNSGLQSAIVSAPYPDAVNPILATRGLAPTCGVGNVDEIVPKLQWRLAERMDVHPGDVRVWLAAHHALESYVYSSSPRDDPPPYLLRVEVGGCEAGREEDLRSLLLDPCPLPGGLDFHFLTASSAIRLILALGKAGEGATLLHVPGPDGLPGGYPVVIEERAVRLALPSTWSRDEAVEVNRASHRWDGIEAIEEDGTVVFTDRTAAILRRTLGFDWRRMTFDGVHVAASELRRRFDAYLRRFGTVHPASGEAP